MEMDKVVKVSLTEQNYWG